MPNSSKPVKSKTLAPTSVRVSYFIKHTSKMEVFLQKKYSEVRVKVVHCVILNNWMCAYGELQQVNRRLGEWVRKNKALEYMGREVGKGLDGGWKQGWVVRLSS